MKLNQLEQKNKEFINSVIERKYNHNDWESLVEAMCNNPKLVSQYNERNLDLSSFKKLLLKKTIIPAGSILAGLAVDTDVNCSLSNCYYIPFESDSIEGIFDALRKNAKTYAYRGGVGSNLSILRPSNTKVNNAAKTSTGAASFAPLISAVCQTIGQQGRRGASIITMSIWHPDIEAFILSKSDPKKAFGEDAIVTDISGANISVMLTDEFMNAVENDDLFNLEFPDYESNKPRYNKHWKGDLNDWKSREYPTKIYKTLRARELFDLIVDSAHRTGDPGILFWDTVTSEGTLSFDSVSYPKGVNPCLTSDSYVVEQQKGLITIDQLNIGDVIWSKEGWTNVVNKWSTGHKQTYTYQTTSSKFRGTDNHRIVQKGQKIEIKDATHIDNISVKDPYDVKIDNQYVIDGLVLGDGMKHNSKTRLVIGHKDHEYFTDSVNSFITGIYYKSEKEKYGVYKVNTTIGIEELPTTYERSIPKRFFSETKSNICSLLRGLYSANGSVVANRIIYNTSSKQMRDDIQLLLSMIGITSYFTTNKPTEVEFSNGKFLCKENYTINITWDRDVFVNNIGFIQQYKNKKIKLNFKTLHHKNKIPSYPIKEIIDTGIQEVFDITVDNHSHTFWCDGSNVSNCGEQVLPDYGNCLLIGINLLQCLSQKQLHEALEVASHFADVLIDINNHPLQENIDTDMYMRKIGIEFTGVADYLTLKKIKYGSQDSIEILEKLMIDVNQQLFESSIERAKTFGNAPIFNTEESRERFINQQFIQRTLSTYNEQKRSELEKDIREYGLRNSAWSTFGPTGTLSIIAGNISSGVEPVFKAIYKRNVLGKEEYIVHPTLIDILKKEYGGQYSLDEILDQTDMSIEQLLDKYHMVESYNVKPEQKVKIVSALQRWTTDSISNTTNLPNSATKQDIYNIYFEGWKAKLKGVTVFRDGCKQGVLTDVNDNFTDDERLSNNNSPITIPDICKAERHVVKWQDQKVYINVTLIDDKPIEIFASMPKMMYTNTDTHDVIFKQGLSSWQSITRLVSMLLRNRVPLEKIIYQLQQSSFNMFDLSNIIAKVLQKYTETTVGNICPECGEATLIAETGCDKCLNCGFSKCS